MLSMFNPTDVFPLPNLSDASTPWARKLTEAVRSVGYEVNRHGQLINGNSRASSAQLGLVSRQLDQLTTQQTGLNAAVDELNARTMLTTTAANVSVTGNATTTPFPTATRSWTFNAPAGGRRRALLTANWDYTNSGGLSNTVSAFSELLQDGVVVWSSRGGISVPIATSVPGAWLITESPTISVNVPADGSTFGLRIHRVGFSSTSTTLTARNIASTLTYGDRY